jgi:hypothetical protein
MHPKNWTGDEERMRCQDVMEEGGMSTQRKRYSTALKARVVVAALKGHKTVNE